LLVEEYNSDGEILHFSRVADRFPQKWKRSAEAG
jgi:hypothetical protein